MTIAGKNLILYLIWKTAFTVVYCGIVMQYWVSGREIPSLSNPEVLKNPVFLTIFPLSLGIWSVLQDLSRGEDIQNCTELQV